MKAKVREARDLLRRGEVAAAISMLLTLEEANDADAAFYLGEAYAFEDIERAIFYYERAETAGHARASWALAGLYAGIGNVRAADSYYKKSLIRYKELCADGDVHAEVHLGWIYLHGEGGVEPNRALAIELLERAADSGCTKAMRYLADEYLCDDATDDEFLLGVKYLRRAADLGVASAQHALGFLYATNRRMPIDLEKALEFYALAHENGELAATFSLGMMRYVGEGCESDKTTGLELIRLAAERGFSAAKQFLSDVTPAHR